MTLPAHVIPPADGFEPERVELRCRRVPWTHALRAAVLTATPEPALVHEFTPHGKLREVTRTVRVLAEAGEGLRVGERLCVVQVEGEKEPRMLAESRLCGRAT